MVAKSCLTLVTSWTVACQAPLSMVFSRQEYWTRVLEWVAKSRPWSIPTQNRVASSSLGLISVPEMEAKSLGAQCRIPIRFAAL